jgi:hypothetical protein
MVGKAMECAPLHSGLGWARQSSVGKHSFAWQSGLGKALECAASQGGPGQVECACYMAILIFIPAGSVEGEEAQGEDPNWVRSYFLHTICRQGVYYNRVRSELPVTDGGVGECVDPEGNGVNPGEGDGGGRPT